MKKLSHKDLELTFILMVMFMPAGLTGLFAIIPLNAFFVSNSLIKPIPLGTTLLNKTLPTLCKIISGSVQADRGEIFIKNKKTKIKNPIDSKNLGISTFYQELSIANHASVEDNVFMNNLPSKFFFLGYISEHCPPGLGKKSIK